MAIDTAAKRLSALDFEEVWAEAAPLPDGSVSQADRQHLVWSYSGILATVIGGPGARRTIRPGVRLAIPAGSRRGIRVPPDAELDVEG